MSFQPQRNWTLLLGAAVALALGGLACSGGMISGGGPPEDSADAGISNGPYRDLPGSPIGSGGVLGTQLPALARAFGTATSLPMGGPCITEPTMGALFPSNFNSPLFDWVPPAGHNIFELRFHVPNQLGDLVVYTDQTSFSIAEPMWRALSVNSTDQDIQVQLRSGVLMAGELQGNVYQGTAGQIKIAPVAAMGAIVYWTTSGGSALKGFHIGDKGVTTVLTPPSITAAGTQTNCIGCHIATPDGTAAVFGRNNPSFSLDVRLIDGSSKRPSWLKQRAVTQLANLDQAIGAMSSAWFNPPSRAIVVSSRKSVSTGNKYELVWTDLAASTGGFGTVVRMGDSRQAATPVFNSNGTRIAYTSSDVVFNSRVDLGIGEVWTVPYNNGQGGAATPVLGAADAQFNQYYPAYAPGDTFLAFNRIPRGTQMYNAAAAEVFLVPGTGGTAVRVASNNPPACAGKQSPGQTNSWPRWSPNSMQSGTKRYYWLVFSSRRRPSALPQLYLTGVVTDTSTGTEVLTVTTPAIYLPNQPATEANHTPAWALFKIPGIG